MDVTNGAHTTLRSTEKRAVEAGEAPKTVGVTRSLLGLPNLQVVHPIEARHRVAAVIRQHRPEWIFLPYPTDAHPDHVAVTRIGEDARFDAKLTKTDIPGEPWYPKRIIYYFCTHLRMNFIPTFCIDVTAEIEQKMASLACYKSQFTRNNAGDVPAMVRTVAGYFGT